MARMWANTANEEGAGLVVAVWAGGIHGVRRDPPLGIAGRPMIGGEGNYEL